MLTGSDKAATRGTFEAVIEQNKQICREHYLLRLRVPGFPATRPGQFVQLSCRPAHFEDENTILGRDLMWDPACPPQPCQSELRGPMALLRRPFSIAGRGRDEDGDCIDLIHRVVGTGTDWLAKCSAGDVVSLIGPLGNRFTLPEGKSLGLMVGGGVGLPPMFYLAEALAEAGWRGVGFVGALTADLLAVDWVEGATPAADGSLTESVQQWAKHGIPACITTDDGSLGLKGRITAALEQYLDAAGESQRQQAVVFTCGPEPMMHAVTRLAESYDVPVQACVEQAMACGMGTCQSCIVKIEDSQTPQGHTEAGRGWRYRLACSDGPVFDGDSIIWS